MRPAAGESPMEAVAVVLAFVVLLLIARNIRGKEHPELVGRPTEISREGLQRLFGRFVGPNGRPLD